MTVGGYLAFLGVAAVLAITPGPDSVLSLRYAMESRRAGFKAAAGSSLAIFGWAGLAAVGVVAVLRSSEVAYRVLSVVGGLYLVYLGMRTVIEARRRITAAKSANSEEPSSELRSSNPFWVGVMTCLTNPKTGLFFLALFPQFTPSGVSTWFVFTVLGGTIAVVVSVYLFGLVLLTDAATRWLRRPRVSQAIELATGLVLILVGAHILITTIIVIIHTPS